MRGTRGGYAAFCAVGFAVVAAWAVVGSPAMLVLGAVVAVVAAVGLIADLRRGRDWHQHDVLIRKLWAGVKRIPPGRVLTDSQTGDLLSVERDHGWLTLAVTDPPGRGREQVVTRYVIGHWGAPVRPPLARHLAALDDEPPARERLRGAEASALEVGASELAELIEQVWRTAVLGATR